MASRRPQAGASHRLFVTVCPLDLWWMLPSVWVFALKHEERVQKAFSVDHHGPEDARLSHVLNPLSGPECDYVSGVEPMFADRMSQSNIDAHQC